VNCPSHPESEATRSCHACVRPLCEECSDEVRGAFYCETCLVERLAPPPPPPPPRRRKLKAPFLAGFLSIVPGLGQVYNGLMARAVTQFIGFILITWTIEMADRAAGQRGEAVVALFVFSSMAYWIWQIRDSVMTARDINRLGRVPDAAEARAMGRGPIAGLDGGSKPFATLLMVVGGIMLLSNLGMSRVMGQLIETMWPIALVACGVMLMRRSKRERAAARRADLLNMADHWEQQVATGPGGDQ
jgi:hypothetical protein